MSKENRECLAVFAFCTAVGFLFSLPALLVALR
jgi:hypothetical protein